MKWYYWVIISIILFIGLVAVLLLGVKSLLAFGDIKRANMTGEQLCKLSDESLVTTIIERIDFNNKNKSTENEKLAALNNTERITYTAAWFDWEVQNGGLYQYFSNSSRYTAPYLSETLKSIGANQIETCFKNFITKYNVELANMDDFHAKSVEEYTLKEKLYPYDEFNKKFVELYEKENILTLTAKYIRDHISDFIK
jgi:hypothetical protein